MAQAKKTKGKKNIYTFAVKKITQKQETQILMSRQLTDELMRERKAAKMVVEGKSYDTIGQELGISTKDAFELSRQIVRKWSGELSMTANEVREIEVKRLDALVDIITQKAFPHEIININTGLPELDVNDKPILTEVDLAACRMLLDVADRRARLIGLDAADKLREKVVDQMTRKYIGGDPDEL